MPRPALTATGRFHTHLLVSDMKASIDFYTTVLGFYYDHGVPELAWLVKDHLLLTIAPGAPPTHPQNYFGWSLATAQELEDTYAALRRRFQRVSAPPDLHAGRNYFFLWDPDDYPIAFTVADLENV
jgi:catechol 2,3-dioxygenase-like lactoylglutathione lyase family enzyme